MSSRTTLVFRNSMMMYLRMFVNISVSIFTTRIVYNALGIEDYGIYNVVGGVVVLCSFLQQTMESATQRFLTFELARGGRETVASQFNICINIHLLLALLLVVSMETLGLWIVNSLLNIPAPRMWAANIAYQFSILVLIVHVVQVPFASLIIAHEKMDFYAYIAIFDVFNKLILAIMLSKFSGDRLELYAFLVFLAGVINFLCMMFYCLKCFPGEVRMGRRSEKNRYREILSFSAWNFLGGLANVGSVQGGNIILNYFYGVTLNSAMGISKQINTVLHRFTSGFQTAFAPQIMKSVALEDRTYLFQLVQTSAKVSFFLMCLPSLPFLLNAGLILQLWLGKIPDYSVEFCRWMIICSLVDVLAVPLWYTLQGTGRIRLYQILLSVGKALIPALAWGAFVLKRSPVSMLVIQAVVLGALVVMRLILLKAYIGLPLRLFFQGVILRICVIVLLSIGFAALIGRCTDISNVWARAILLTAAAEIAAVAGIILFGFDRAERRYLRTFLQRFKFFRRFIGDAA